MRPRPTNNKIPQGELKLSRSLGGDASGSRGGEGVMSHPTLLEGRSPPVLLGKILEDVPQGRRRVSEPA